MLEVCPQLIGERWFFCYMNIGLSAAKDQAEKDHHAPVKSATTGWQAALCDPQDTHLTEGE